jgi:hypothetical protein
MVNTCMPRFVCIYVSVFTTLKHAAGHGAVCVRQPIQYVSFKFWTYGTGKYIHKCEVVIPYYWATCTHIISIIITGVKKHWDEQRHWSHHLLSDLLSEFSVFFQCKFNCVSCKNIIVCRLVLLNRAQVHKCVLWVPYFINSQTSHQSWYGIFV